jgi:uncharacterized protein (TIGR02594 family)
MQVIGCNLKKLSAFEIAKREIGVAEKPGPGSNPRVNEYLQSVGLADDFTPWCAAFVNWCLLQASVPGTKAANARSFENWGTPIAISAIQPGDIVVLTRGVDRWKGHVGFYVGPNNEHPHTHLDILGGNQADKVSVARYDASRVITVRRQKTVFNSKTIAASVALGVSGVSSLALHAGQVISDWPTTVTPDVLTDEPAAGDHPIVSVTKAIKMFVPDPRVRIGIDVLNILLTTFIAYERNKHINNRGA